MSRSTVDLHLSRLVRLFHLACLASVVLKYYPENYESIKGGGFWAQGAFKGILKWSGVTHAHISYMRSLGLIVAQMASESIHGPQHTEETTRRAEEIQTPRVVTLNDPDADPVKTANNSISTSKYNPITFLPYFLWEMFSRVAYLYFLVQVILKNDMLVYSS